MEIIANQLCKISENNIHIENSYNVKKPSEMFEILYAIQSKYPNCNVFKRSYQNLVREWIAHNRLYQLGLWKSHTVSVDLNYPMPWHKQLLYNTIGAFIWQ